MEIEIDHYAILGLPSGIQGAKLSEKDIIKAYKIKALKLHPDKRRDDPNAHNKFQRLYNSYEILKDKKTRLVYDNSVRVKHEEVLRELMRKKMMDEVRKRELVKKQAREDEERRRRKQRESEEKEARREEKRRRREMRMRREMEEERRRREMMEYLKRKEVAEKEAREEIAKFVKEGRIGVEKGNVVKVSWDRIGKDYTVQGLREMFQQFGEVRYVLMRSFKVNKGSAFIVLASKDAVVAVTRSVVGYLDNPLLVLPVLNSKYLA